ncbi:MAG: D-alanine--D-alanine ligase [Halofilum sp. (in: g-proteobacteria)]|nr:D-alanine--D-alanine ligase [Halofilum sp. (in: g-proteobacteria)]
MPTRKANEPLHVGVVFGDPRMPYLYSVDGRFGAEEIEGAEKARAALETLAGYRFTWFDDHERLIDDLRAEPPELVLNLCDTGYRNDWELERNIPAFLEMLGIPYTGADPMSISVSTDKALVSMAAARLGILVPNETFVDLSADPLALPATYPALIKPNASGGSFGITDACVVHDAAAAEAYLRWLAGELQPPEAVIQDFLTGAEFTVGVIGNPAQGFTVLPPLEVDYSRLDPDLPPVLTYGSKADPESPYWNKLSFRQAEVDEVVRGQLVDGCAKLFKRLAFRDYARFDFRNGADGQPRLLDANTNPTWYWDGKMAMMAGWAGYSYADLLRLILEAAEARYGLRAH